MWSLKLFIKCNDQKQMARFGSRRNNHDLTYFEYYGSKLYLIFILL